MPISLKTPTRSALEVAIAFTPWLISAYVLYWLEYGEIWTTETAHRGKMTGAILVAGMGLSFLVKSYFNKRNRMPH
jgi:hypothetical protein